MNYELKILSVFVSVSVCLLFGLTTMGDAIKRSVRIEFFDQRFHFWLDVK